VSLVSLPDGGYNVVTLNRRPRTDVHGMCDPSYVAWNVAFFTANSKWKSRTLQIWTKPYEEGWYLSTSGSRNAIRQGRAGSQLGWLGVVHVPTFRKWLDKAFRPLPNVPVEVAGSEVQAEPRAPGVVSDPVVATATPPPPTHPAIAAAAEQEKSVRSDAGHQPPSSAGGSTSAASSLLPETPTPPRVIQTPARPPEPPRPEDTTQKPAPAKSVITIRPIETAQESTPAPEVSQDAPVTASASKKVPPASRAQDAKKLTPGRSRASEKEQKDKQKKSATDDSDEGGASPFGVTPKSEESEDPFSP
jgi:hypothetical protein